MKPDCEKSCSDCKDRCFEFMEKNLIDSDEEFARGAYQKCLASCERARKICEEESNKA